MVVVFVVVVVFWFDCYVFGSTVPVRGHCSACVFGCCCFDGFCSCFYILSCFCFQPIFSPQGGCRGGHVDRAWGFLRHHGWDLIEISMCEYVNMYNRYPVQMNTAVIVKWAQEPHSGTSSSSSSSSSRAWPSRCLPYSAADGQVEVCPARSPCPGQVRHSGEYFEESILPFVLLFAPSGQLLLMLLCHLWRYFRIDKCDPLRRHRLWWQCW